jgi:type VII secretion protein EccE
VKARTLGVNASIPVVVGVEVAVLTAILIFPPGRWSWWPTVATAVVAILLLMLTVYRRNAVKWCVDRFRWRRRRRRTDAPAPSIDIPHGAALYVRRADTRPDRR